MRSVLLGSVLWFGNKGKSVLDYVTETAITRQAVP